MQKLPVKGKSNLVFYNQPKKTLSYVKHDLYNYSSSKRSV